MKVKTIRKMGRSRVRSGREVPWVREVPRADRKVVASMPKPPSSQVTRRQAIMTQRGVSAKPAWHLGGPSPARKAVRRTRRAYARA